MTNLLIPAVAVLGLVLFGLLSRWAARHDPRRFRIVAPRVFIPVGGALCLGMIVAAGLRLGDFRALSAIGVPLIVAGISILALPIPPPDGEGGDDNDPRDNPTE